MTAIGAPDVWIRGFHPKSDSEHLLVCFPHAGGSASYYFPMSVEMPGSIEMRAI